MELNSGCYKIRHTFIPFDHKATVDYDVELFAVALNSNRMVNRQDDLVFCRQPNNESKSLMHVGDCISGCPECGSDSVWVYLNRMPADVCSVIVLSHLYDAEALRLDFSQGSHTLDLLLLEDEDFDCAGKLKTQYRINDNFQKCDFIKLCVFERTENGWSFSIPDNSRLETPIESYFQSIGIHI